MSNGYTMKNKLHRNTQQMRIEEGDGVVREVPTQKDSKEIRRNMPAQYIHVNERTRRYQICAFSSTHTAGTFLRQNI